MDWTALTNLVLSAVASGAVTGLTMWGSGTTGRQAIAAGGTAAATALAAHLRGSPLPPKL